MFTGIVTDVGTVEQVSPMKEGIKLRVATSYDPKRIDMGASISHSGICLTVTGLPEDGSNDRWFEVEAWEEALRLTTIGTWASGTHVNLERSLNIVSGHIDGKAEILSVTEEGEATRYRLRAPEHLARFVAPKGSIALDGTSLTVNAVHGTDFDVLLIRHTLEVTTWGERRAGDFVNFEVDTMARYAARLAEFPSATKG
jgi:riboflavin synthase